ncbi:uncharacterized protein LOC116133959 isoform X2 [Pistacia vera]|uniref:uncharacterized protein LOC116133959 isoform X2 n=1 Tax=Pistacia vera TaxID=55513 RepID=UPI001263D898|nr:uncharacterized protein LOC116133959 isoform X2 [Pistacia vera]
MAAPPSQPIPMATSSSESFQSDMEQSVIIELANPSRPVASSTQHMALSSSQLVDLKKYLPLYKAILGGDLRYVQEICNEDEHVLEARITENSDTALHVAVGAVTANHIVDYLLTKMSNDQVALTNKDGKTVLSVAAIVGNVQAAKKIREKWPDLLDIKTPLIEAARHGYKEMITYLLKFTDRNLLYSYPVKDKTGVLFVHWLIIAGFYDLAMREVEDYPNLALMELDRGETLLSTIAKKRIAFSIGRKLNFFQNAIYISQCIFVMVHHIACKFIPSYMMSHIRSCKQKMMQCIWSSNRKMMSCIPSCIRNMIRFIEYIWSRYNRNIWSKYIHYIISVRVYRSIIGEKEWTLQQKNRLAKALCMKITRALGYEKASSILKKSLLLAAESGVHEVVEEIIKSFPDAVLYSDQEQHNAFHLAVINRHKWVINLIFEMSGHKHLLLMSQDNSGNNILHLAGKLAPLYQLNRIPGAALKMQRELQWFKEVEKIVPPSIKEDKNSQGKTPAMVFVDEHQGLVKKGEKWMKDAATSCSIVTVLIATVVFAAAITVPGGTATDGTPNFYGFPAFTIFAMADAVSLFSSIAAVFMFMSILTARYAETDFLFALPKRLILGLFMLFLSLTAMMVAFGATVYMVNFDYKHKEIRKGGVFCLVMGLAFLPVSVFAFSQFPLLVELTYSTYGPSIFRKRRTGVFYKKGE